MKKFFYALTGSITVLLSIFSYVPVEDLTEQTSASIVALAPEAPASALPDTEMNFVWPEQKWLAPNLEGFDFGPGLSDKELEEQMEKLDKLIEKLEGEINPCTVKIRPGKRTLLKPLPFTCA